MFGALHLRSVVTAGLGKVVHFAAPTVRHGWVGPLTLETINIGPMTLIVRPGMDIVEEVRGDIFLNPSELHGQSRSDGRL
ncbi:MAG: hypothetical protein JSU70_05635 [Phycisphaerales bacterium]|nr:MAG: hypothetical protein JSU70_05635 [Phycisphaerales bacterium]